MTSHAIGEFHIDRDLDGCVDCDTYTPAEFEVVTGTDVIAGEPYEIVEKMCLVHKIAFTERQTGVS